MKKRRINFEMDRDLFDKVMQICEQQRIDMGLEPLLKEREEMREKKSKINVEMNKELNEEYVEQIMNSLTDEEKQEIEKARKKREEKRKKEYVNTDNHYRTYIDENGNYCNNIAVYRRQDKKRVSDDNSCYGFLKYEGTDKIRAKVIADICDEILHDQLYAESTWYAKEHKFFDYMLEYATDYIQDNLKDYCEKYNYECDLNELKNEIYNLHSVVDYFTTYDTQEKREQHRKESLERLKQEIIQELKNERDRDN